MLYLTGENLSLKLFSPVCVIASCGRNAASFVFFTFIQKIELSCKFFWCPSLWPLQVCPDPLYSFNGFLHLCNFTEKVSKNIDQKIPRTVRGYILSSLFFHISFKAKCDKQGQIFTSTGSAPHFISTITSVTHSSGSNPWLLGAQASPHPTFLPFFPQVHDISRFRHKIHCSVHKYGT